MQKLSRCSPYSKSNFIFRKTYIRFNGNVILATLSVLARTKERQMCLTVAIKFSKSVKCRKPNGTVQHSVLRDVRRNLMLSYVNSIMSTIFLSAVFNFFESSTRMLRTIFLLGLYTRGHKQFCWHKWCEYYNYRFSWIRTAS